MDLNVEMAELGWKFKGQLKGDAANLLATAADFRMAMDLAVAKQQQALTNPVKVLIFNLVCAFLFQVIFETLTFHLEAAKYCTCGCEKAQGCR